MNKRQRKKNEKKQEMFISSFDFSYKAVKKLDRMYHEYEVCMRKQRPFDHILDMDFDEFDEALLTEEQFIKLYCNNCGSQRCEGINSEWFEGCKFKDQLDR